MSIDALRWAFEQQGIKATHKLVLLALADRASEDCECWPSLDRIEFDTCLNRHTICAALDGLVAAGLIEKHRRFSQSTVYRLVGVLDRASSAKNRTSAKTSTTISAENSTTSSAKTRTLTPIEPPLNPKRESGPRFAQPSHAEVVAFVRLEGLSIDPEYFVDYYTSNGWRVGKSPMKDWRATARNWHRRDAQKANPTGARARSIQEELTDRSWAQ